jgi:U3 small nucleolar RNA-associated protein 13
MTTPNFSIEDGPESRNPVKKADESPAPSVSEIIDGIIPYTERYLGRLDRLVQESYIIDLIIGEMDNGFLVDEFMDVDGVVS